MLGVENEGVEEDAGVDGAMLAALTSVFDCGHIKRKNMNDKDGWECGWCGGAVSSSLLFTLPGH